MSNDVTEFESFECRPPRAPQAHPAFPTGCPLRPRGSMA
jgi:hypothetical protein